MSATSDLIRQHIGTVERLVVEALNSPEAKQLYSMGCLIKDGVFVLDEKTGIELNPYRIRVNLHELSGEMFERYKELFATYLLYIQTMPEDLVRHAFELDTKRADFKKLCGTEAFNPGSKLYWAPDWDADAKPVLVIIESIDVLTVKFRADNPRIGFKGSIVRNLSEVEFYHTYYMACKKKDRVIV